MQEVHDYLTDMARTLREDIINMTHEAGSGHPGGSLSAVEIMTALYFGGVMEYDPEDPDWEERDYFILSKGHAAPVLYSALARAGFYPVEELSGLRKMGSMMQGHPHAARIPGCECSAGSLGQGLSVSNGLALAWKAQNRDNRVYCLMGDGELQEGQVWEAVMTAAQHQLDHVCAIVDYNHIQLDGRLEDIKDLGNLVQKFTDFGWNAIPVDGHDMDAVMEAFREAEACKGKPSVLVAETVKGKGVSFMENDPAWHGTAPDEEQTARALEEIRSGYGFKGGDQ